MATLGIHTKYKAQETSTGSWMCFKEHRAMNDIWWRAGWLDRGLDDHREAASPASHVNRSHNRPFRQPRHLAL